MITIEQLIAEPVAPDTLSATRPPGSKRKPCGLGVTRLVSRDEILRHDGAIFVNSAFVSVLDREPEPGERWIALSKLAAGEWTKRDVYEHLVMQTDAWWPVGSTRWLLDIPGTEWLTLRHWLEFSVRFFWFRLKLRFAERPAWTIRRQ